MEMRLHEELLMLHRMRNSGMMRELHMDWMTKHLNTQAVTISHSIVTDRLHTGLMQTPRNITGKRIADSYHIRVCLLHETRFCVT